MQQDERDYKFIIEDVISSLRAKSRVLPPKGYCVFALQEPRESAFESDVNSSELLSRGWVYQEVLLAPANLFCTKTEMWWSCACASCSRTAPTGVRLHELDRNNNYKRLNDSLRRKKKAFTVYESLDPIEFWIDLLHHYGRTSLTIGSDRLVAIAGIAGLFRSQFSQLKTAAYHSGVWSVNIVQQLLWHGLQDRPSHSQKQYHIPSWSPLSYEGTMSAVSEPWATSNLPIQYETMGDSSVDRFGRAKEMAGFMLHLRGVLVEVQPCEENRLKPPAHEGDTAAINVLWDTTREREFAASTGAGSYHALICNFNVSPVKGNGSLVGILLRPLYHGSEKWIRCANVHKEFNFEADIEKAGENIRRHILAYQIEAYGQRIIHTAEEGWNWESTGTEPELRDICIV